jgi:ankyrin repeat protein
LWMASINGHTDVVRLLLENGADVNVRPIINNIGWTALKVAKAKGYTEIVQLLESAGAKE